MKLVAIREVFPFRDVFAISRGARSEQVVVSVTIEADGIRAHGECTPYARYGESAEQVIADIEAMAPALSSGLTRLELQQEMPPGAARNALDCALWDLEAKRSGKPVWALAGLPAPGPVITAYTIALEDAATMNRKAAANAWRPLLKIKLGGEDDVTRLEAVRAGAPASRIIVDANEGWSADEYAALAPTLLRLGVDLVEQPLPADADDALAGIARPLPVCADESCHDRASLAALAGKYDMVNIKLDKTGGLTEALALRDAARQAGFSVMVGCMVGSSLAMAPAVLVAQSAAVADLDGPLLLGADREPPLVYDTEGVHPADPALWG
ncbi:N-acetyl-D-Glu racemase DgcA [Azoarcus taiwanensis]|uniref:Dipeptide epimerase n=1 Tax=Azoarcus taiwanensis TaxID=666964 RepID=A0A972J949_9RHOO|nr:N-acetyl-D-Glu racemase DgcA [Azoarcus taiwanensis]NMG01598.1 dipeptide epimerase [Azoarcus taiwanensis]